MRYLTLLLFVSLSSCLKTEQRKVDVFYNVDSLVTAQVESLTKAEVSLRKNAGVQGQTETSESKPDGDQWERELSIFRSLDINEPRLVPLFMVQTETDMNGVSIITYTSEDPESTEVQWFKIRQDGTILESIEGEIADKNPIYGNQRVIGMSFSSENRLVRYFIRGGEKLASKDTVQYSLEAEILR